MAKFREPRRINLALQGGGAHGAFTWGVLERLLDEPWLEISGISGTSAGALNGAALKAGLAQAGGLAGRRAAAENLRWLWGQVAEVPNLHFGNWAELLMPHLPTPMRRWIEATSPLSWMDAMARIFSPYDYGKYWRNPLQPLIEDLRFHDICSDRGPAFFISATNVRTGKIRVFTGEGICVESILASACIPTMFQAVEIDDPVTGRTEAYWDGGFSGNPALFPLFVPELPRDVLVVGINPLLRDEIPRSPTEIENRINEISFNAALLGEMRAINFARRLIADGRLNEGTMKDVLMHIIADDELMVTLGVDSKMMPDRRLLTQLRSAGQLRADEWLEKNADLIGVEASVNLAELFG